MLSLNTFLKHLAIFILTLFVVSFITAILAYLLIRFVNGLDPKEAYSRGMLYVTVSEEWALAAYIVGISFLAIKSLYPLFHLNTKRTAKIKNYMLVVSLVFIGFGFAGVGTDWGSLYIYAFLIPLLIGAFLLVIVEDKLIEWLF